ncbi:unnamed protein product [Lota lota]
MANVCTYGRFTHAIVRGVPATFGRGGGGEAHAEGAEPAPAVDLAKAQRQLGALTGALRQKVGLQLIEIPPDPELPDSWRVEDVAVIQGDTALITRPFEQQRRAEAEAVRRVVSELNLTVVEMGPEEGATLEGSDVLFTGREFFVGISAHTNHRGAEVLADTFRDFAVSTVPVCGGTRLKNICSMGGPDTIVISNSDGARKTLRVMEQLTDHRYEVLAVPEDAAANCVYVRGANQRDFLLHRPAEECPESVAALQKLQDYTFLPTACSEVAKLGANLSSLCLLVNRKHTYF